MILLLILGVQASCPKWECKSLDRSVCAQAYGIKILANSEGCPLDHYCKLKDVAEWHQLNSLSLAQTFNCTRQNYEPVTVEEGSFYCGKRHLDSELQEGTYPKVCETEKDCLTKGGWTTSCLCGLDGNYYCMPELSSSAFEGYWELCEEAWNATREYRVSATDKAYWEYFQSHYIETISAPECMPELIWEFLVLGELERLRENSGSFKLSVGLVWLIFNF